MVKCMQPIERISRRVCHAITRLGWAAALGTLVFVAWYQAGAWGGASAIVAVRAMGGAFALALGLALWLRWRGSAGPNLPAIAVGRAGAAGMAWPAMLDRLPQRLAGASFGALFWRRGAHQLPPARAPHTADVAALLNIARLSGLDDPLPALAEHVCGLLGARLVLVASYDEQRGELLLVAGAGCAAADSWLGRRVPWPAAQLAAPVTLIGAAQSDLRLAPLHGLLRQAAPLAAVAALPLLAMGQPAGLLLVGWSHQRTADAQVLQLAELAAGYVAAAVAQARLHAQAQQALRARATVLGTISHEFRTPITVVLGFAELYQEGVLGAVAPEQHEALDAIGRNANRLLRLVDGLIELARAESGELDLTLGTVDLALCLSEVQLLIAPQLAGHSCTLRAELDAPLPYVRADALLLRRALLGLIGYLAQSAPGQPIDIRVRSTADSVLIVIRAPGYALPAVGLAQFFAVFPPPDGNEQNASLAARMGLALGKHILDAMGAEVRAERLPDGTLGLTLALRAAVE